MTLIFDNLMHCPPRAGLPDLLICRADSRMAHFLAAQLTTRPRTLRRGTRCACDLSHDLAGLH